MWPAARFTRKDGTVKGDRRRTPRRSTVRTASVLQTLAAELDSHQGHTRHVAARARQTVCKSRHNRIRAHTEHDGKRQAEVADFEGGGALRHDQIDWQPH